MSSVRFRAPHVGFLARYGNLLLVGSTAILCLVPLLLTPVLPFIDFYAHILRYQILAQSGQGSVFAENYAPAWKLLPNLGLDVIGTGVLSFLPPLVAAKVIAALIMYAPFAGTLYLARVLHGHIPVLSVALAGILVFNNILVWGFANFLLGLGIAIGGVGYWIAASDKPGRQLGVSAVIGIVLLFVHALSFALWGLLLGAVELMLAIEAGKPRLGALAVRAGRLLSLAVVPSALFLQMDTVKAEHGVTVAFSNLFGYAERGQLGERLRDELWQRTDTFLRVAESFSPPLDRALGMLLWGTIAFGLLNGIIRLDRRIRLAAAMMLLLVAAMPPNLFGVGYVDDRIPLVLLTLLAAGLILQPVFWRARVLLWGLIGLFALRTALVGWGYYQVGDTYRDYLDQITQIDTGRIAASLIFSESNDPDIFSTTCKPLRFLLAIKNGTAVSTFANPTQQPLLIIGPLSDARSRIDHLEEAVRPHLPANGPSQKQEAIERYFTAGFDTVVVCDEAPAVPAPVGTVILAHGYHWTLYRRLQGVEQ